MPPHQRLLPEQRRRVPKNPAERGNNPILISRIFHPVLYSQGQFSPGSMGCWIWLFIFDDHGSFTFLFPGLSDPRSYPPGPPTLPIHMLFTSYFAKSPAYPPHRQFPPRSHGRTRHADARPQQTVAGRLTRSRQDAAPATNRGDGYGN